MYTAIVVYHAPQMKNWRNIITDSLVRITASRCRYREFLRQSDNDVRPRRQNDVRVLRRVRGGGARGTAHDAADDRALAVTAEHPAQHRARDCARSHLGRVTGGHAAALVHRLERVHRSIDRVCVAPY